MKIFNKLAAIVIGATALLAACTPSVPTSYTVTGLLPDSSFNGMEVILRPTIGREVISTDTIDGNKFVFEGVADSAMFIIAHIKNTRTFCRFILENGDITLDFTSGEGVANGTEYNKIYNDIVAVCDTIKEENIKAESAKWFAKHNNDVIANALIMSSPLFFALDDEAQLATIEGLGENIKKTPEIERNYTSLKSKIATAPGKQFIDFNATDIEGKPVKFSDYVGKGNYVLVDMWASWCGPCKREIPNLAEVHNLYKDKGLTVLGVFVWDELKNLEPTMKAENISWTQIIDNEKCATQLYGVDGIPAIMLIGPDGTILERGGSMRGANMKATVEKYLLKK